MSNNEAAATLLDISVSAGNLADIMFMAYLDTSSPAYDRETARSFGLDNWADLSNDSHAAWDWVFGRENRLPGWVTRDITATTRIEDRVYDREEQDV